MKKSVIALTVTNLLLGLGASQALQADELISADADSDGQVLDLESITVTGSYQEQTIGDYVGSLSVVSEEQINRRLVNNIQDLVRYEPGVSVEGDGRFGFQGFNIRGLGDDRVLILVDGIPVAEQFSFGPNLSSGRNVVDVDSVKSVEILKGPASSIYGSDALAGVVQFVTKTPYDYLSEDGGSYFKVKTGYQSADESAIFQGNTAFGNDSVAAFLSVSHRSENEQKSNGDVGGEDPSRTKADTQSSDVNNLLAKLEFNLGEDTSLIFTLDYFESEVISELESESNSMVRGTRLLDSRGVDDQERTRISADYRSKLNTGFADSVDMKLYWQATASHQETFQDRFGMTVLDPETPLAQYRERYSDYQQEIFGGKLILSKELETGDAEHLIHYGLDYSKTDSESKRDGFTQTLQGIPVPEFSVIPVRDFPISNTKKFALFLSNQITMGDWRIIPGLRYDQFEHNPTSDALYLAGAGNQEPVPFDDDNLSFKLGVSYQFTDGQQVYAQLAEGFRIPAYDDVNVAFTNFAGGYKTLSNPNLEPEESQSLELGVKGKIGNSQYTLAVYHNDYKNFIESRAPLGFNRDTGLVEFQAQNLDDVQIRGLEAKLTTELSADLLFNLGLNISDSEDKTTGEELDSVAPNKVTAGLDWAYSDSLAFSAIATLVEEKQWVEENSTDAASYQTLDLYANWLLNDNMELNLGIFNLFDETYWTHSNLLGRPNAEVIDRFSAPGRNISVNLQYQF